MFVDVEFPIQLPPAITVPVDAVLDAGLKKTVFVDRGQGYFEPRKVETGWRLGDRIEITKGLSAGERIAISGAFLLDSESRMELAAEGMDGDLSKDPVCGLDVSIRKAEKIGRKSDYQGKTYYFSSEECRARFIKDPDRYAEKPAESSSPARQALPSKTSPSEPPACPTRSRFDSAYHTEFDSTETFRLSGCRLQNRRQPKTASVFGPGCAKQPSVLHCRAPQRQ